jgi:hypothetical protein
VARGNSSNTLRKGYLYCLIITKASSRRKGTITATSEDLYHVYWIIFPLLVLTLSWYNLSTDLDKLGYSVASSNLGHFHYVYNHLDRIIIVIISINQHSVILCACLLYCSNILCMIIIRRIR